MDIVKAADNLLAKGEITKEECELVKKAAAQPGAIGKIVASLSPTLRGSVKRTSPVMNVSMQKALPWIQGGLYSLLGASVLKQLLGPLAERAKTNISFNKLIEKNPILAEKDPGQIKDYFNVIETFSPKAASNPLVAGALVNKMMEFGGVDHKLVQDLAAIQSGLRAQSDVMGQLAGAASKSLFPATTQEVSGGLDLGGNIARESNIY